MKTSNECIKMIKKFEGCRLRAYRCPAGVWTIGYGHTNGVRSGMSITQKQADEFLKQDLEKYESHVNGYDNRYHWTQNEFDALVSFAYNIGNITGLTSGGTRSKNVIAKKILLYNKANGVTLPGLVKRRQAEHDMFIDGDNLYLVALEVIRGKYGTGKARTEALKNEGYDPKAVQKLVNSLLKK